MNKVTQAQSSDELAEGTTQINSASKNSVKNTIPNQYLFKENTRKEKTVPAIMGQELSNDDPANAGSVTVKKVGKAKDMKKEEAKLQEVRNERELKRKYLSTLSTRFNPDILTGGTNS